MRTVALIISTFALAACGMGANAAEDGGPRTAQDFPVGDFHAIATAGAHDVLVKVGGTPSVRAEGPQAAIERLDIRVEDGTLKIGNKKQSGSWIGNDDVTVHVTAPRLDAAALAGSGDLSIDQAEAPAFKATLAGSGDLEIGALRAGKAELSLAGSGDLKTGGNVADASISLAGSGDIDAHVTGTANVSLAGSGDVHVTGGAKCTISKRGSGEVRCD